MDHQYPAFHLNYCNFEPNKNISQNQKIMVEITVCLCIVGIVRAPAFILAHLPLLLIQYYDGGGSPLLQKIQIYFHL